MGSAWDGRRSVYWWETVEHAPRPAIEGRHRADVAIVGGGFTGLWTAYQLLVAEPSMNVAIVEGERVTFGASGRNGGFAMTLLDMSLSLLRRNRGDGPAKAAHDAVARSVGEIGETVGRERIACEWVHGGLMVVATNPGQLERVDADWRAASDLGLEGFRRLSAEEAQAEVRSPTYAGALAEDHCGVLNPSALASGLATTLERMGAALYQGSPMTGIHEEGSRLRVETPHGDVLADQVVLATNAWASATPWFRRKVVPLYTYMILTEPLTEAQWAEIGWGRRQGIEDKRNYVHYYRRTADGRISWGGVDGIVHAFSRIARDYTWNEGVFDHLAATFRRTFPQLGGVTFTHAWGGPVAITATFTPYFGTLLEGRLHYGLGYNGHGVAPSHTGGKILRDKVLGKTTELTGLFFVDAKELALPPEPLRWIGSELTRQALLRQDRAFDHGKGSGEMDPWLLRVMKKFG